MLRPELFCSTLIFCMTQVSSRSREFRGDPGWSSGRHKGGAQPSPWLGAGGDRGLGEQERGHEQPEQGHPPGRRTGLTHRHKGRKADQLKGPLRMFFF